MNNKFISTIDELINKIPFLGLKAVVSFSITETAVRMVELEIHSDKPKITNYAVVPLKLPNNEEEIEQVVKDTIDEAYRKGGFKVRFAFATLLSGSVFSRKISLPNIPAKDMKNAIHWEATNQIPFNLDTAYFDSVFLRKKTGKDGAVQTDHMIAAINKANVDILIKLFSELNLKLVCLGLPSFALAQFAKLSDQFTEGDNVAVVDIDSNKTNITVIEGLVLGFSREVPVGYNTLNEILTSELSDTKGVHELGFIEELKQTCDFQTLLQRRDEVVSGVPNQRIYASFSLFHERLISELRRSLDYFRTQGGNITIQKIVLTGVGTRLINLAGYIEQHLLIPSIVLKPVDQFQFDETVKEGTFMQNVNQLLIPIGAALARFDQINFLPYDFRESLRNRFMIMLLVVLLTANLLIASVLGMAFSAKEHRYKHELRIEKIKVSELSPQIQSLQQVSAKYVNEKERFDALNGARFYVSPFLKDLSQIVPDTISLRSVKFNGRGADISGFVFEGGDDAPSKESALVDFIINLNDNEMVEQASLVLSEVGKRFDVSHNVFNIRVELKSKLGLVESSLPDEEAL